MADSDTGVALLVVGIVLMAVGIFFWPFCGLGIVLIIVGLVLIATGQSQPAYYYPVPTVTAPPIAPPPPGSPPPAGVPPATLATPACPVCGSAMMWVPQYGRWYCTRCQAYR